MDQTERKVGRPSTFSQEVADVICERIVQGDSLRKICADEGMPAVSSVMKWLTIHSSFAEQYARAKEEQAEALADEIVSIADEGEHKVIESDGGTMVVFDSTAVARNRLRVDARKWVAAKLKPKKYGDKVENVMSTPDGKNPFEGITIKLTKPDG